MTRSSQLRQISWVISGRVWRPWSWFRFYRLLFHFWPSYCIWTRANQTLTVIRKNVAAHWHCSRPVNHCAVSFSNHALMRWNSKNEDRALSRGKARGRKTRGGEAVRGEGGAESWPHCCVFSHRQQQRKWNGAAKYTGGTMRQRAWSSCGTLLSPRFRSVKHWRLPLFTPSTRARTQSHIWKPRSRTRIRLGCTEVSNSCACLGPFTSSHMHFTLLFTTGRFLRDHQGVRRH